MPTGARKVLIGPTPRSASGSGTVPAGCQYYDASGGGSRELVATGPAWCATCVVARRMGPWTVRIVSAGPESTDTQSVPGGGQSHLWCEVALAGGGTDVGYSLTGLSGGPVGRYQEAVDFAYSVAYTAELVEYVALGEPDPPSPDPLYQYPDYGGTRVPGEHPTERRTLVWELVVGTTLNATVTVGDATATLATTAGDDIPLEGGDATLQLYHSPCGSSTILGYGDATQRPDGTVSASHDMTGADGSLDPKTATYTLGGHFVCSGTLSDAGHSASVNTDDATGSVSGSATAGVEVSGVVFPIRKATIQRDAVLADGSAYPASVDWPAVMGYRGATDSVDSDGYHTIVDPPEPVVTSLAGQSVTAPVSQRREYANVNPPGKSFDLRTESGTWVKARGYVGGAYLAYQHYRNEQGPVAAWKVSPEAVDWRVPTVARAEDGLSVAHAESLAVALPSPTADGSDSVYTPSSPFAFEGYRYLEATGSATALVVGGKRWALAPGSPTTVDLCYPAADGPAYYDAQNTRWPLDAARRSRVATPYWGVSTADSIRAEGGTLDSLTLKATRVRLRFLAPFADRRKEVPDDELTTSGGDPYTVEHYAIRLVVGDVDGRQGHELPHVRITVDHAPGRGWATDYAHLAISALPALFAEVPGWSATSLVAHAADDRAWYLGAGWVRQGAAWSPQTDLAPGTVRLQGRADWVEWTGDPGDVYDTGNGLVLTLAGRWVARGSAYGSVKADATVRASDLDGSGEVTQSSAAKRYGLLGPPHLLGSDWGKVWVDAAHKAVAGSVPRMVQRVAFGVGRALGLAYDVGRNLRHARLSIVEAGLATEGFANSRPFGGTECVVPSDAAWVRVRFERADRGNALWAMHGDGTTVRLARSLDEGASYETPMTIGSGKVGDLVFSLNGPLWLYWVDGATVRYRTLDLLRGLVEEGDTNVTDASGDGAIAADDSAGSGGEWRMALYYLTTGGARAFVTATDGKTFS